MSAPLRHAARSLGRGTASAGRSPSVGAGTPFAGLGSSAAGRDGGFAHLSVVAYPGGAAVARGLSGAVRWHG